MSGATVSYRVQFKREPVPPPPEPVGRVPRVARLLALAHKIDAMICSGEIRDMAHAARLCGLTRARVTQVCNLLLLAPEIQEAILQLPAVTKGRDPVTERNLREIVAEPEWERQIVMFVAGRTMATRTRGQLAGRQRSL